MAFGGNRPRLLGQQAVEPADEARREVLVSAGLRKGERTVPRAHFRVVMVVGRMCELAANGSATRLPISAGPAPAGQPSRSFTGAANAICKPMAQADAFEIIR